MLTVLLPWPPQPLHPNGRPHRQQKARVTKAYRGNAYWSAMSAFEGFGRDVDAVRDAPRVRVQLTFRPPDRRNRDEDGMQAAVKAGLDGIADALGINDHRFAMDRPVIESPVPHGQVVVRLTPETDE